jgi:hypothetical protein
LSTLLFSFRISACGNLVHDLCDALRFFLNFSLAAISAFHRQSAVVGGAVKAMWRRCELRRTGAAGEVSQDSRIKAIKLSGDGVGLGVALFPQHFHTCGNAVSLCFVFFRV